MKTLSVLIAVVSLITASAAQACKMPPARGSAHQLVSGPVVWATRPNGDTFMRFYPPRTDSLGEGRVVMRCTLTAQGSLTDCLVTEEAPPDKGFGRATQNLARYFRMNMQASCARPGMDVLVPVHWVQGG
jgi:TonB family protein